MVTVLTAQLDSAGRVLIPMALRKQLQVEPGSQVLLIADGTEVRLTSKLAQWRAAQKRVVAALPANAKLTADLRRLRKKEAQR